MANAAETELLAALQAYAGAAATLPPQDPRDPVQYGVNGEPLLTALRAFVDARLDAARQDERRACLQAVEAERLDDPNPESEGDAAYDRAIEDAAGAIRARGGCDG